MLLAPHIVLKFIIPNMTKINYYCYLQSCFRMYNEAHARIKINKLLEEAGWRFFDTDGGRANILLENHVKITQREIFEQKIKDRIAKVWGEKRSDSQKIKEEELVVEG